MKAQRNDKCPCGSGLKYKNCCLSTQTNIYVNPSRPVQIGTMLTNVGKTDWSKVKKTPVNTGKVKLNNMSFELNEIVENLTITDNKHLGELVRFYKEDKKAGLNPPFYYFHAKERQWMAFDKNEDFAEEMNRFQKNFKNNHEEWITEAVVYKDVSINGEKFSKLTMRTIGAMSLNADPTPMQFSRIYTAPVNAYITLEK